jgi:hypothetical protein
MDRFASQSSHSDHLDSSAGKHFASDTLPIEALAAETFYRTETAVKGSRPAKIQLKLGHRFG